MNQWILICNNQYFDIKKAFTLENTITWPQVEEISVGDIVYFYVSNPCQAILYKCEVEELNLKRVDNVTRECVTHVFFYGNKQIYMRLRLLKEYPEDLLTSDVIKKNGIYNLQNTSKVSRELSSYIENIENPGKKGKKAILTGIIVIAAVAAIAIIIGALFVHREKNDLPTQLSSLRDGIEQEQVKQEEINSSESKPNNVGQEEDNKASSAVSNSFDIDSLEIYCYTTTILVGDTIDTRLKSGSLIIDGRSESVSWLVDNGNVASIDDQGVLMAKKAGTCIITAELEGKTASQTITVVDIDENSGAEVSADYEKVSMNSGSEDTVVLTFGGNMPKHFGASAYYSAGMSFILEWGDLSSDTAPFTVPLTIKEFFSLKNEGYVTVLVYDQDNPEHIVAATKINIHVTE